MTVKRIAIVTAGGHVSCFHASMKRMHEVLERKAPGQFELVGARMGVEGLTKGRFLPINPCHLDENRAGSLVGADRKIADTQRVIDVIGANGIYAVIMMGGDNHLGEAQKCFDAGIRIVGWPKTMDGDLSSGVTLGWDSAVTVGAMQTRNHHNTAMTYGRVFFVGLFGRDTDWVVTAVAAYGGGDLAIPAEREYDTEYVKQRVLEAARKNRDMYGISFAVVPYSEGARVKGIENALAGQVDAHGLKKLSAEMVGARLVEMMRRTGQDAVFQAHTYDMRDSPPTLTDIRLARMAAEECIAMILEENFGNSVVFERDGNGFFKTSRKQLGEVAAQRRVERTGFFDYERLTPTTRFVDEYGNLFRASLGEPPAKDKLVYPNMLERG